MRTMLQFIVKFSPGLEIVFDNLTLTLHLRFKNVVFKMDIVQKKEIQRLFLFFLILFNCFKLQSQYQEEKIKSAVMFHFGQIINWPGEASIDTFRIGVYSTDSTLYNQLITDSKKHKIKQKPVSIVLLKSLNTFLSLQILYTNRTDNKTFSNYTSTYKNKGTLLITDHYKDPLFIMVNFIQNPKTQSISFDINKQNLDDEGLTYNLSLLQKGGEIVDLKEVYLKTYEQLNYELNRINSMQNQFSKLNEEKKEMSIVLQQLRTREDSVINELKKREQSLLLVSKQIEQKTGEIERKNKELDLQKQEQDHITSQFKNQVSQYKNSIEKSKQNLKTLNNELYSKQQRIENQSKIITQKDSSIKEQRFFIYISLTILVALIISAISLLNAFNTKRRVNQNLEKTVGERTQELKIAYNTLLEEVNQKEKYEKELAKSERNYREIFNASTEAIFIHNADEGKILDVNNSMLEIYGYSKEEINTISFNDISSGIPPFSEKEASANVQKAIREGKQVFEWHARKKNGQLFWVEVALKATYISGEPRILAVVRDINEKKLIALELEEYRERLEMMVQDRTAALAATNEELISTNEELHVVNTHLADQKEELESTLSKLKDTQNKLIRSEKLASLGVFTAGIAHEINNPINYISAGTSALFDILDSWEKDLIRLNPNHNTKNKDLEQIREAIEVGIEKTTAIISSLRNYSHSSDDSFVSYNSIICIKDAMLLLHNNYKYKIQITENFPDNIEIECIPGKLNQVFVNILNNSIQSITDQGEIVISAFLKNEKEAIFEFADNGKGIKPEIIDHIFDPFFTTKEVGKGTGLGLYIVHGIIEQHKGEIKVSSEVGKGTTMHLRIPVKQQYSIG